MVMFVSLPSPRSLLPYAYSPMQKSIGISSYRRFHFVLRAGVHLLYRSSCLELCRIWEPTKHTASHHQPLHRQQQPSEPPGGGNVDEGSEGVGRGRAEDPPSSGVRGNHTAQHSARHEEDEDAAVVHVRWTATLLSRLPWVQEPKILDAISVFWWVVVEFCSCCYDPAG